MVFGGHHSSSVAELNKNFSHHYGTLNGKRILDLPPDVGF